MKSNRVLTLIVLCLVALPGCSRAAEPAAAAAVDLSTEDAKTLYSIGLQVAANLRQLDLSEADLKALQAGIVDGVLKREAKVDLAVYGPKMQAFAQGRTKVMASREGAEGEKFLASEAAKAGAEKTASGLIYSVITAGTGASPKATDTVTVHYHGTLRDGLVFDSSVKRGQPATFALNQVVPCWTEGVQKMKVGGKSRLVCPPAIAYGERGSGPIPPNSVLVFEVELISIGAPAAAEAPASPHD